MWVVSDTECYVKLNWDVYNMNMNVNIRCILYIQNICWLLQTEKPTQKAVTVEYQKKGKVESSTILTKMFFVFPTFQPSLSVSMIHTPSHGHLSL